MCQINFKFLKNVPVGDTLENPIWQPSAASLNCIVVCLVPENTRLDTNISIACHQEANILTEIDFYMAVILKIKYSRQNKYM